VQQDGYGKADPHESRRFAEGDRVMSNRIEGRRQCHAQDFSSISVTSDTLWKPAALRRPMTFITVP